MTLSPTSPIDISSRWLSSYALAFTTTDPQAVADQFLPHGWLRDVLTFSWDMRSLEGPRRIAAYLSDSLLSTQVSNLQMCDDAHFRPTFFETGSTQGVQFGYTYETRFTLGKGFVQLLPESSDAGAEWKALTASMIIVDLKGHEENPGRYNYEDVVQGQTWDEYRAGLKERIETDPQVIVGQSDERRRSPRY